MGNRAPSGATIYSMSTLHKGDLVRVVAPVGNEIIEYSNLIGEITKLDPLCKSGLIYEVTFLETTPDNQDCWFRADEVELVFSI